MSTLKYKFAALKGRSLRLKRPSRKTLIIGALILVFIALLGFRAVNNGASEPEVAVTPIVSTIDVNDYRTNGAAVQASGEVTSVNQVTITGEVGVPVRSVLVNIGDQVFAGQPLVEFEHDDLDAQLAQTNAALAQANVALTVQEVGARPEDKARARLAVTQAEQSLFQAIAGRDQTRIANDAARIDIELAIENAYADSIQTTRSTLAAVTDGLVVVADYQDTYFGCSSNTICKEIELAKREAMLNVFDLTNAGNASAASILRQSGGLVARVDALSTAVSIDPAELHSILTDLESGLQFTREALVLTREGFETAPGLGATTTDKTTVETERAAIDAAIVTLQTQMQTLDTVEGGGLVGGLAKALYDEDVRADAALRSADAAVAVAETGLASAEQSLLILENGARDIDLASLRASVLAAEASRDNVAAQYRRYIVTAPFDGVVATLPARAGQAIGVGQTVVSLVNPSALEVVAYVSDQDRPFIETGATVSVNDTYQGIVTFISPSIDPTTGKVEVRVAIIDPTTTLTVGQFIPVEIARVDQTDEVTTYQLPLPAVRLSPAGSFVFVINDEGVIEQKAVETGTVFGERVEITSGLDINDTIASSVRGLSVGDVVTTQ